MTAVASAKQNHPVLGLQTAADMRRTSDSVLGKSREKRSSLMRSILSINCGEVLLKKYKNCISNFLFQMLIFF